MKSKKIISVLLLLTLLLTSCNKASNNVNTSNDNVAQEEQSMNENNDDEQDNIISEDNSTDLAKSKIDKIYDLVDKKYDNHGLHITYPQITNLNDKDKQNKINEMIKSEALIVLPFYTNTDGTSTIENANFEVNYEIKFESNNMISMTFSGTENDKGFNHPIYRLYTLNIDLNNCTKLKLSDLVSIDEKFINNLKIYRLSEPGRNGVADEVFKHFIEQNSNEELLECFKSSDSSYETSQLTFSYITKDYIAISTGVQHGVGDCLEIKLKYEDVKDNIKSDSIIWDDILNSGK